MKILLVSFYNDEAYGVRVLHSNLIDKKHDTRMLFFKVEPESFKANHAETRKKHFISEINNTTEYEITLLIDFIKQEGFEVIAFSLVSSHFRLYKKIHKRIKDIEGLTVVIGGWQPSLNPEQCIVHTDYLCIGEGDVSFPVLIDKLAAGQTTDDTPNFWINKKDGTLIKNQVAPLTKDLSAFPIPLYEHEYSYCIENDQLVHYEPYLDNIRYGTFIGRGCPHRCTYCSNSFMANSIYPKTWSKVRYRNAEHVKSEMMLVKEKFKNVRAVNFYDEVFTPKMDWIRDFFSWYKQEINIPFYCFFFPGACSDEKCAMLSNAGMTGVWMGVQSGSQRVRSEVFQRFYSNEKVLEQACIFEKYGVSVRYDFILDNPFETFDESLESIYLMFGLSQPFSLNLYSLKYFPNTKITEMAIKAGFITPMDLDDNRTDGSQAIAINYDAGNLDDKFIDSMAFYISCQAKSSVLLDQKDMLYGLIDNYKCSKDITPIKELLKPYLV